MLAVRDTTRASSACPYSPKYLDRVFSGVRIDYGPSPMSMSILVLI